MSNQLCGWCRKTYGQHVDFRPAGAPVPRVPCGGLKEFFWVLPQYATTSPLPTALPVVVEPRHRRRAFVAVSSGWNGYDSASFLAWVASGDESVLGGYHRELARVAQELANIEAEARGLKPVSPDTAIPGYVLPALIRGGR